MLLVLLLISKFGCSTALHGARLTRTLPTSTSRLVRLDQVKHDSGTPSCYTRAQMGQNACYNETGLCLFRSIPRSLSLLHEHGIYSLVAEIASSPAAPAL